MTGGKKSVGPDCIPGEIPNKGEAMIARHDDKQWPYTKDWKKAIGVPIHKEGDRSIVKNYSPASLTSVACKQMEHVIAGYIRQMWEDSD
jgi:hypothetical protein